MAVASFVFQLYLFLSAMLVAGDQLHKQECYSIQDKLYMINGYAHYLENNETYFKFITDKQSCIFNGTAYYDLSLQNISNISNGTFTGIMDRADLLKASASGGKFK